MAAQLGLFGDTIEARFRRFHAENPHVYRMLCDLAREYRARGCERIGVRHLWEVMRWKLNMQTTGADGFKLNDHFHSRYAHLIDAQEPDLRGLFELRGLKA